MDTQEPQDTGSIKPRYNPEILAAYLGLEGIEGEITTISDETTRLALEAIHTLWSNALAGITPDDTAIANAEKFLHLADAGVRQIHIREGVEQIRTNLNSWLRAVALAKTLIQVEQGILDTLEIYDKGEISEKMLNFILKTWVVAKVYAMLREQEITEEDEALQLPSIEANLQNGLGIQQEGNEIAPTRNTNISSVILEQRLSPDSTDGYLRFALDGQEIELSGSLTSLTTVATILSHEGESGITIMELADILFPEKVGEMDPIYQEEIAKLDPTAQDYEIQCKKIKSIIETSIRNVVTARLAYANKNIKKFGIQIINETPGRLRLAHYRIAPIAHNHRQES